MKRRYARCAEKNKRKASCPHQKGRTYNGKVCHTILNKPTDAYEFSFVAVPAQKNAGVTKQHSAEREQLRKQVSRLFYLCDTVLPASAIKSIVDNSPDEELEALKRTLEKRLAQRAEPQLVKDLRADTFSRKCDNSQFSIK